MPAAEQGVALSRQRYQLVPRVLCFVFAGDEVLLLKGAPDKKIWPGRYNGLGGHVERDETIYAAARREIHEEAGLEVDDLRLRGVINIDTGEDAGIGLFVFTAVAAREAASAPSNEGVAEWVPLARVPTLPVVDDVPHLLRYLTAQPEGAPPFSARYSYNADGQLVIAIDGQAPVVA